MPSAGRSAIQDVDEQKDERECVTTVRRLVPRQPLGYNARPLPDPLLRSPSTNDNIIWSAEAIHYMHAYGTYFTYLPSRVGHSQVLDATVQAMVTASLYRRGSHSVALRSCYELLINALQAVRKALGRLNQAHHIDDTLASIAMLSIWDGVVQTHNFVTWSHIDGFEKVMTMHRQDAPLSELAQSVLEYHCCDSSVYACVRGQSSPFESVFHASYNDWRLRTNDSPQMSLSRIGNIITITLPRLVAMTRRVAALSRTDLESATTLAAELYQMRDTEAENIILHGIAVRPIISGKPVSFHYESLLDFSCIVGYWQARGALLRVCHHLSCLRSTSLDVDFSTLLAKHDVVEDEFRRLSRNLLMSSDYALSIRNGSRRRLFAHGMVTLWGGMKDFGDTSEVKEIRARILCNINAALTPEHLLDQQDLDEAAELFVGGPIRGKYACFYGLTPT